MKKIKVDIISGFLGAGKTTFIKKIVQELYSKENVVILENEFGKINIDKETLQRESIQVKPIQASCICCTGFGDLANGILEIIREYAPERIIIEPTGIAKLSEVKKIFKDMEIASLCELDHIVTIVDGKNYYSRMMVSKEFFENQIRASEVIILNKTESMQEEDINRMIDNLHILQPNIPIVTANWQRMKHQELKALLEVKKDAVENKTIRLLQKYKNDFESFEFITDDSINMNDIRVVFQEIEKGEFGELHRGKGICKDPLNGWYSVEYVPGELNITSLPDTNSVIEHTSLCFIGRNINRCKLTQSLQNITIHSS